MFFCVLHPSTGATNSHHKANDKQREPEPFHSDTYLLQPDIIISLGSFFLFVQTEMISNKTLAPFQHGLLTDRLYIALLFQFHRCCWHDWLSGSYFTACVQLSVLYGHMAANVHACTHVHIRVCACMCVFMCVCVCVCVSAEVLKHQVRFMRC